ncbi:MAG: ABC transporter ATP-binding protein [Gemmatimonadota bacterium]
MAVVEARALVKHFDGHMAVDGIDVRVREGEFLVLLGPSGCGKTTLLRMLAGLEAPTSGDVLIDGRVVTELPPRERNVAMVFQSYALYPHLSVFSNIAFPLQAVGTPRREIEERVRRAAAMFGLEPFLARKPRQLSGGERQRVALARALVREPVVFLLDEPLSNLDAKLRASARAELEQFQERLGTTTIYVTHDQIEAMGLGDRIAVLEAGRLHQIDTPTAVYGDPEDTFVATFLGSPPMNLVRTEREFIGFRPEHYLPRTALAGDGELIALPFTAERVENLGADRLVYGTLAPPLPPGAVIARLPTLVPNTAQPGARCDFAIRARDLRRFALDTGRALRTAQH